MNNQVHKLGVKLCEIFVFKNGMEQLNWQFVGKIGWPIKWTNLIENLFEQSGEKIVCTIWWNNWVNKYCWKMGGQFGWKN